MDDQPTSEAANADVDDEQHTRRSRARIPWVEIWNSATDTDNTLGEYLNSLPSRSRCRKDPATCRYRILTCESSTMASVSVDGIHSMTDPVASSPRTPSLTDEMKVIITERLMDDTTHTSVDFLGIMCKKIQRHTLEGPASQLSQVQKFVGEWRKAHKQDAIQPIFDLCCQHMYDSVQNASDFRKNLIVLCDTTYEDGNLTPKLGKGSLLSPFRIGLTCYSLMETYVSAQNDPRSTTIFHIDSTHSVVKQTFPVFVFGISDCRGKFFPVIYYCTSNRTAKDIEWCLDFTKRVVWETFMVSFSPQFVMTDADNAQYNACQLELPGSKILMCWFHVCKNVKEYTKGKLERVTIEMIFRDMNSMHYALNEEEFETRRANVLAAWRSAQAVVVLATCHNATFFSLVNLL